MSLDTIVQVSESSDEGKQIAVEPNEPKISDQKELGTNLFHNADLSVYNSLYDDLVGCDYCDQIKELPKYTKIIFILCCYYHIFL